MSSPDYKTKRAGPAVRHKNKRQLNVLVNAGDMLDALPVGAAIIDRQGQLLLINHIWENVARELPCSFGRPGQRILDVPENRNNECSGIKADVAGGIRQTILQAGEHYQADFMCSSSGENRFFSFTLNRIAESAPPTYLICFEETTSARQAEMALHDSEHRFKTIFEKASIGKAILDVKGRVIKANRALSGLLEYKDDELAGREFFNLLRADDLSAVNEKMRQLIQGGRDAVDFAIHLVRKNGNTLAAKVSAFLFRGLDDTPVYFILHVVDVSGQIVDQDKKNYNEEIHSMLFDAFPALVWRAGMDGMFNYVNKAWLDFTGKKIEREVGSGWIENIHPEEMATVVNVYMTAFHEKKSFTIKFRMKNRHGSYQPVICLGRPYYENAGVFAGYIGYCYNDSAPVIT